MGLIIPFDPAGLTPATISAFDELIAGLQTWAGKSVDAAGKWSDVGFSAGNFTSTTGTWVVGQDDIIVYRYAVIGDTLLYNVRVARTTTTGTPNALIIDLPPGYLADVQVGRGDFNIGTVHWLATLNGVGVAYVQYLRDNITRADHQISMYRDIPGTAWPNETNNLIVEFNLVIPIVVPAA